MTARAYELMIIVDTDEPDSMVDDVVRRVDTWIHEGETIVASVDKWGKRKFAYEINHKMDGHYVVLELAGPPRDLAPLERMLNLADEVVRHKIVRLPEHEALKRELVTADGVAAPPKPKAEKPAPSPEPEASAAEPEADPTSDDAPEAAAEPAAEEAADS